MNLASTELFEFNKAVLTKEARVKLDSEVVAKLGDLREVKYIIVNGHADRLGSSEYNQKLSEKRADAVRAYLGTQGVAPERMQAKGYGKDPERLIRDCTDVSCKAQNRRVVTNLQEAGES